ncbi:PHP domain-containing protein [Candidatus Berkelbacteria bacterium]|nr:PHP domain-containing protein [Candidatus Berkelbacteria bacterium]
MSFVHLHCHSHYSLLKALPKIDELIAEAVRQHMPAIALTDNGALYGAIEFYEACHHAGIKPIIGCELYMPQHLTVLAENYTGYKNLMQLVSRAALEGLHDGVPCVSGPPRP